MENLSTTETTKLKEPKVNRFVKINWDTFVARASESTPNNILLNENIALIGKGAEYLRCQLLYQESTIKYHRNIWRRIIIYLYENEINFYDRSVEDQLTRHISRATNLSKLSEYETCIFNSITFFSELKLFGKIVSKVRRYIGIYEIGKSLGRDILSFIEDLKSQQLISAQGVQCHTRGIAFFYRFCQIKNIVAASDIQLLTLLEFRKEIDLEISRSKYLAIGSLRKFLKFIWERGIIETDHSLSVPAYIIIKQIKLPSVYSKEEIEKMLSTIEQSSPLGKRNYAIILLAVRLGLRASDIVALKLEHLNWEKNTIEFTEFETQRPVVLPLLADVGNAIISYLKFGRQKSEEQYVFLVEKAPYGHFLNERVVSTIVQTTIRRSRIKSTFTACGSQKLSHSAAASSFMDASELA